LGELNAKPQNVSSAVSHDQQSIEQTKQDCRHDEHIHGSDPRPTWRRDFQSQYDLNPARCHFMTVSGFTISKAFRTVAAKRSSPAKIKRSVTLKVCLFGEFRRNVNLMPKDQDLGCQRSS
jgi:hypothetical protein